jgi:hypothetical protein
MEKRNKNLKENKIVLHLLFLFIYVGLFRNPVFGIYVTMSIPAKKNGKKLILTAKKYVHWKKREGKV